MGYVGKKPADIIATAVDTTTGTFSGDLTVDTSTLYVDSANNRVGIGTTSPAFGFEYANSSPILQIKDSNSTGNAAAPYVRMVDSAGTLMGAVGLASAVTGDFYVWNASANPISFLTNSTERMRIDSSGNVGIGTSSPATKLDVLGYNLLATFSGTDTASTYLSFKYNTSTVSAFIGNGSSVLSGANNSDFIIRSQGDLVFASNGNNRRATIDSSGNLLVGRTSSTSSTVGCELDAIGRAMFTRASGLSLLLNRTTDDGSIAEFRKDNSVVGSIGSVSSGANLYISANSGVGMGIGGDNLYPVNASGASTDGQLDIGDSTARFKNLYLSGGAYIGGTGSANYLDDYEEGTWSPTISTGTATLESARYIKVGRMVQISVILYNLSDRSSSTNIEIGNLPFTSSSTNQATSGSLARYWSGGGDVIISYIGQSNTGISLYNTINSNNYVRLRHDHASNSLANAYVSMTYESAS